MRLQVSVHRNALPPVRIVHNTSTRSANSVRASTIAELLDSISTLVPLESADGSWGLEDYVVEVRATSDQDFAYECLHYQLIEDVLQEDDEVIIRALRSEELRERRVGGRLQISGDGRHLLDGVSWGRRVPLGVNGIVRPQVEIPPRKRRRIDFGGDREDEVEELLELTYPGEGGEDEEDDDNFEDNNYENGEDSDEDDDDDHSEGSDEDELEETAQGEIRQIKASAEFDNLDSDDSNGDEETAEEQLQDELQALFEDTSPTAFQFARGTNRNRSARSTLSSTEEAVFSGFSSPVASRSSKRPRLDSAKKVSSDHLESDTSANKVTGNMLPDDNLAADDEPDTTSESDLDSDEDDSEEFSSEQSPSERESSSDSTDDSDDLLSSSATSDVPASEKQQPNLQQLTQGADRTSKGGQVETMLYISDEVDRSQRAKPGSVPPGEGMSKTKRNNARKRRKKLLNNLQDAGILDENANFATLREHLHAGVTNGEASEPHQTGAKELNASQAPFADPGSEVSAEASEDRPSRQNSDQTALELAAKKRELLRLLNAQESAEEETSTQMQDQTMAKAVSPMNGASAVPASQDGQSSSPQRAKLDLASSRRMLFSSLGVRNPKTPEEERALRERLSKPARVSQNKSARELADKIFVTAEKPKPREHWSEKLIISAVECHYIGRKIDVPSFPFKHPWQMRRERLSKGFDEAEQEHQAIDVDENLHHDDSLEKASGDVTAEGDVTVATALEPQLIQEPKPLRPAMASTMLMTGETEADHSFGEETFDELLDLKWSHFGEEAIIAFKELELGPNYEPIQSGYKKARIHSLNDDGTFTVEMLTFQEAKPVQTDEITGLRVFSKFEMPISDEIDDADDRFRDLSFSDLIQPKLVKAAHTQTKAAIEVEETETQPTNVGAGDNDEYAIIPESVPVAGHDIAEDVSIAISTQTRNEINGLIKDAGFDSGVDEQLLQPPRRDSPSTTTTSSPSARSRRSQHSEGGVRLRGGSTTNPEDACVFGGPDSMWNSSPPQPSPALELLNADVYMASSDVSESIVDSVRYPHLSQLGLDTSMPELHTQPKGSSFQDAQIVPPGLTLEDTTGFGSPNLEESFEKPLHGESANLNLEYLGSEVSQSQEVQVKSSPPRQQDRVREPITSSRLVDGSAEDGSSHGHKISSDSDIESLDSLGLPSLRTLTSSQRNGTQSRRSSARIGQRSPDSKSQSKAEMNGNSHSTSSHALFDDDAKFTNSQVARLSQIPEDAIAMDLTQTSSPTDDDRAGQRDSPRTRASKRKAGQTGSSASVRSFSRALSGLGTKKTSLRSSQV